MASPEVLKFCIASVGSTQKISRAMKMVVAALIGADMSSSIAHAAPPTLQAAQPQIKAFCAHAYPTISEAWTLCVSQGTQGYVDFADAYPKADPPLMEAFDRCQARFAPRGNWALLGWCARERARYFEEMR